MEEIPEIIGMYQSGKVLVVPINGELYDKAMEQLKKQILQYIHNKKIYGVLIDVSSVNIFDRYLIEAFTALANMIQLLGAEMVLAGVKPTIAITLSELSADISGLTTAMNMERGMAFLEKQYLEKMAAATETEEDAATDESIISDNATEEESADTK